MTTLFENCGYATAALIAGIFTWSITALGAAVVFLFKHINNTALNSMLGFAGGVMTAASFWSLLEPAIADAETLGQNSTLITVGGFICGGLLLFCGDLFFNRFAKRQELDPNSSSKLRRTIMLVFSITLHNIPEGLAIGVAFGSVSMLPNLTGAGLFDPIFAGAWMLAVGIGIQNFPEGTAVSVPLRREGMSRLKSFAVGQASALVEPVSAVIGALIVASVTSLMPFLLSFAAGAMIYVVVAELIPESQSGCGRAFEAMLAAMSALIGFAVMMALDTGLG